MGGSGTFNHTHMEMRFDNTDGVLAFRSLDDPNNARGFTFDGVIFDEAGFIAEGAWDDVCQPMLLDTFGWAILMGTPNGRNWFWRVWHDWLSVKEASSWQIPTLGCVIRDGELFRAPHPHENPAVHFEEIFRLYHSMSERAFRQEILAEFIEDSGMVFRNIGTACVLLTQTEPVADHIYCMGVDWGKSQDFTVITVYDATNQQQVSIDRFNQIEYSFQVKRLRDLIKVWDPFIVMAEGNSMGGPLVELMMSEGLPVEPFTMTSASKRELIEDYALAIERGNVKLLADSRQVMELEAYEIERLPSGIFRYGAPTGAHDDIVISGALGWFACKIAGPAMVEI